MSQQSRPILTLAVISSAAILARQFVSWAGAPCAAAARAMGVARAPSDFVGQPVPVDVAGTAIVNSGGVFASGDKLQTDASGNAVEWVTPNPVVAVAVDASTGAGQACEVLLVPGN